jgi:hypothetical protein
VFIKKRYAPLVDIGKLWSSLHNFKLAKLLSIHKEEFPISSAFSIRPFTGINIRRRTTPLKYQTCVEGIKKLVHIRCPFPSNKKLAVKSKAQKSQYALNRKGQLKKDMNGPEWHDRVNPTDIFLNQTSRKRSKRRGLQCRLHMTEPTWVTFTFPTRRL